MAFPTKNDQHLGCEMGVPPFKETPKCWCKITYPERHPVIPPEVSLVLSRYVGEKNAEPVEVAPWMSGVYRTPIR